MLSKKKFVFEKGCDPKNPLLAEYGDGWGLFKILCLLSSISKIFSCAFLPHKINTKFSFRELSEWSILSVNISQPLLECEEGLEDSTVKIVLSNKTPCFAQFERSPCWDGEIFRSELSSLNIFCKEGGILFPISTEKLSPLAWFWPWYGSWPIITTFKSDKLVNLKALKTLHWSGYIVLPLDLSCSTKDNISTK